VTSARTEGLRGAARGAKAGKRLLHSQWLALPAFALSLMTRTMQDGQSPCPPCAHPLQKRVPLSAPVSAANVGRDLGWLTASPQSDWLPRHESGNAGIAVVDRCRHIVMLINESVALRAQLKCPDTSETAQIDFAFWKCAHFKSNDGGQFRR
jgi:hypothetical protein